MMTMAKFPWRCAIIFSSIVLDISAQSCEIKFNGSQYDCARRGLHSANQSFDPQTTQYIVLYNNSIATIGTEDFEGLSIVAHIVLTRNMLTSITNDMFNGLTTLVGLQLDQNIITSTTSGAFADLISLKTLELSANVIKYTSDAPPFFECRG